MNSKSLIGLLVVLGLLVVGAAAFADGPGFGRGGWGMMNGYGSGQGGWGMMGPGMMNGYGPGPMWGPGYGPDNGYTGETAEVWNELNQKRAELDAVLSAPEVDEAKAKSLQAEINKLESQLAESRLAAQLEFRKANPGFQGGYGPGYCWR